MRKFVKGGIASTVDDDDRRIPEYIRDGWKEVSVDAPKPTEADKRTQKAIADANASEPPKKGKRGASNKKVNDAIQASATAAAESEAIDDGLLSGGNK